MIPLPVKFELEIITTPDLYHFKDINNADAWYILQQQQFNRLIN